MQTKERNRRAVHALAGLMLVGTVTMVYVYGTLERKLTSVFSSYVTQDLDQSIENLDRLIEARQGISS